MGLYRQTLYLQSPDETTIFRQPGLIYSSDYSRNSEVPRNNVRSVHNCYPESRLRIGSNELAGKLLRDVFAYSDIHVVVYTLQSHGVHAMSSEGDPEFYAEDEIERYSEEFHLDEKDLETDFTKDSKSCQHPCDEQIHVLRENDLNNRLIEHYLQYQPKELVGYIKEFDFQYSDIIDEEMTLLIDMLLDSRDVYSQDKFDVGETRQKFRVTLKPKAELKRQRPSKVPLPLK